MDIYLILNIALGVFLGTLGIVMLVGWRKVTRANEETTEERRKTFQDKLDELKERKK